MTSDTESDEEAVELSRDVGESKDFANAEFSTCDKLKLLVGALCYALDTLSDLYVAYTFYRDEQYRYFGFTLFFFFASPIPILQYNLKDFWGKVRSPRTSVTKKMRLCRIVCTAVYPLAVYPRYIDCYNHGCRFMESKSAGRNREAKKYFELMNGELDIIASARIWEGFSESGPQLWLQLIILGRENLKSLDFFLIFKMLFLRIVSLSWTIASSRPILRRIGPSPTAEQEWAHDADGADEEPTWLGTIVLWLAHMFGIAARCILIMVTGNVLIILAGLFVHFLLLLWTMGTDFTPVIDEIITKTHYRRNAKKLSCFVTLIYLALISLLTYPHTERGLHIGLYWLVCIVENGIMLAISPCKCERVIRGWVIVIILLFGIFYTNERRINKASRYLSGKFSALRCSKAKERREKNMSEMQPLEEEENSE